MLWGVPLTVLKSSTSPARAEMLAGLNRYTSFSALASSRISWTRWASAVDHRATVNTPARLLKIFFCISALQEVCPAAVTLCAATKKRICWKQRGSQIRATIAPLEGPTVGRRGIKEYRAPEALILIAADRDQKPLVCPSCGSVEVERVPVRSSDEDAQ